MKSMYKQAALISIGLLVGVVGAVQVTNSSTGFSSPTGRTVAPALSEDIATLRSVLQDVEKASKSMHGEGAVILDETEFHSLVSQKEKLEKDHTALLEQHAKLEKQAKKQEEYIQSLNSSIKNLQSFIPSAPTLSPQADEQGTPDAVVTGSNSQSALTAPDSAEHVKQVDENPSETVERDKTAPVSSVAGTGATSQTPKTSAPDTNNAAPVVQPVDTKPIPADPANASDSSDSSDADVRQRMAKLQVVGMTKDFIMVKSQDGRLVKVNKGENVLGAKLLSISPDTQTAQTSHGTLRLLSR